MYEVSDFLLDRLPAWGIRRIYGYPGDGINGILWALGRAGNRFEFIQTRHDEALLSRLGIDYTLLNSGCCGMAGPFGFEADHYDLSLKIGERILLPAVRNANRDTLIIADGYSCREQIAQTTNRRALHLA